MSESRTIVFGNEGNSSLNSLLPFLQQRGIDPAYLAGLMGNNNGGFFGNNAWEGIIALIVVAAIFGNNGNGGIFGGGNNNSAEREMLMSAIQRNGTDLSQLAQTIGCSNGRLQDAIGQISTQICNFAGQNGLSFQQVINSIQAGNANIVSQLCDCCCKTQNAITTMGYENQLANCQQTNTLVSTANTNAQMLRDSATANTNAILSRIDAMEKTNLMDKIDALREKNAQQAVILNNTQQTAQFAAMLAPIQSDLAELKCNQLPVKKIACPESYVPVNNSINATYGLIPTYGCGCGLGYGYPFGFVNGFNNAF